jgi:hypothetical protein
MWDYTSVYNEYQPKKGLPPENKYNKNVLKNYIYTSYLKNLSMSQTPEQIAIGMIKRAFIRFGKAFIGGGIGAVAVIQPPLSSDPTALVLWGKAFAVAFICGGLLALEKLISQLYVPTSQSDVTPAIQGSGISAQATQDQQSTLS